MRSAAGFGLRLPWRVSDAGRPGIRAIAISLSEPRSRTTAAGLFCIPAPIGSEVQPMDSRCYRVIKGRLAGRPSPWSGPLTQPKRYRQTRPPW